uniref:Mutator-like transposase domain-containing protein n=1 Tax=Bracon brevicornis TaxID=1563983 RepID=A0A6V7KW45_9HYME
MSSCEKTGHRYQVNTRFAFVMRTLGLGLAGCNKFCGLMDMASTFLSKSSHLDLMKSISCSVKTTAEKFLVSAANEETQQTRANSESDTLTVSGDGTWQKQGFSSSFGVTSLIGYWSGKVIDIFISSLHCQACKLWEKQLNTDEFKEWYQEHVENNECQANPTGPSGNMEVNAVIELLRRSEKNYGAKISNYIGDGDSETYGHLSKAKPYGKNFTINKKNVSATCKKEWVNVYVIL